MRYPKVMPTFIRRMFSKRPPQPPGDYSEQRESLQSAKVKERLSLAKNTETNKEILYYLAEHDPDPKVRKAVVQNESMPVHVSPVLAMDNDQDVRLALAKRLMGLLPDLSQDKHSQLYAFAVQALGTLALDEVLKIRIALSSTLKDHAYTPPKIAGQLARDVEREVSEPVLRFCAALSDEDLLDILKDHPEGWVVEAIARRDQVSEDVSEAVIETQDVPGGQALIENEGAQIGENLLQVIVDKAREFPEWQKPMALRKSLPLEAARELASFVDASVRDLLVQRGDFDAEEMEEISEVFRRRMDFASKNKVTESEPAQVRLQKAIEAGDVNEDALSDALGMRDYDFVIGGLAYLAKTQDAQVQKIMDMGAAKSITALCWKAGVSMRLALQLQKTMGKVQPKEMLYPKDGSDYPLSEEELQFQVDFLGL